MRKYKHLIVTKAGVEFHGYNPNEVLLMDSVVLDVIDKLPDILTDASPAIGFRYTDGEEEDDEEEDGIGFKKDTGT